MHSFLKNVVVTNPFKAYSMHLDLLGICTFLLFASANSINVDVGGWMEPVERDVSAAAGKGKHVELI